MYRYGEDFCNEDEVRSLLDNFLQKKQFQDNQPDTGNTKESKESKESGANAETEKNTVNIDYMFDR